MSFLLDTNVVSEVRNPAGNQKVKAWISSVEAGELYLSVLVLGEIRRGIERIRDLDPLQASRFEQWLDALRLEYADRVLPVTADVAEEWGRLNVSRTLPATDGLLAATARVMGLTFVTRNTADVAGTGVSLLNPFEA